MSEGTDDDCCQSLWFDHQKLHDHASFQSLVESIFKYNLKHFTNSFSGKY